MTVLKDMIEMIIQNRAVCHKQDRVLVYEEWQLSPLNTPPPLLRDQLNAGTEMSSKITAQGCKNVMPGQGYHTPHGAVIDIEQWMTGDQEEEMKRLRRKDLLQCHFFNHGSYMKLLRTEPWSLTWEASTWLLKLWHGLCPLYFAT